MRVKFIIFVVFASLAQGSFALLLNVTYGLSEEKLATLNDIIINQKKALAGIFDGINPLFDLIQKDAAKLIYNLQESSNNAATVVSPTGAGDVVDSIVDSIVLIFGTSNSTVEEERGTLKANLVSGYGAVGSALALATVGNYSANKAQLEAYRKTAQDQSIIFIQSIYDLIRCLANTSDIEALAVIGLAQSRSATFIKLSSNAALNAISLYGAAVTTGSTDVSLITRIESYRENSLDGLEIHMRNLFSLLRAYYINLQLSPSVDLAGLYSNQYSQTVGLLKFNAVMDAYFEPITTYLKRVGLQLQDSGRSDFSPADASEARALAKITAGYEAFLDSILVIHPDAEDAAANARATLSASSRAVVTKVFDIIEAAQDPAVTYSESLRIIEASSETGNSATNSFVDAYFDLIRNDECWNNDSETEFNTLRDAAVDQLEASVYNVQDAIKTLAEAVDADVATECDFSAVETAEARAVAVLDLFTQTISAAGVVQLKASTSSA